MLHLGKHIIAEFYDCDSAVIDDISLIESIMTDSAKISGATIIKPFFHRFSPQGVSGIIVISESHFAIHTWPEHGYAAVDIFSCSDFNYKESLRHIRDRFRSGRYLINCISRGLPGTTDTSLSITDAEIVRL